MSETIDTKGEVVDESGATDPNEGASEEGASSPEEGAAEEGAAEEGAAEEGATEEGAAEEGASEEGAAEEGTAPPEAPPEETPTEAAARLRQTTEPDQLVMQAMLDMVEAAKGGAGTTLEASDGLDRKVLIKAIAFQLPNDWINAEVARRIETMETEELSLVLSWLALVWWQGYEIARNETIQALRHAAERGTIDGSHIGTVEKQIKEDREARAREEKP